jgi:hypothetical protein
LRVGLVGSHGRWKGPCLQTNPHERVSPLKQPGRRSTTTLTDDVSPQVSEWSLSASGGTPPLGYPAGRVVTPASLGRGGREGERWA